MYEKLKVYTNKCFDTVSGMFILLITSSFFWGGGSVGNLQFNHHQYIKYHTKWWYIIFLLKISITESIFRAVRCFVERTFAVMSTLALLVHSIRGGVRSMTTDDLPRHFRVVPTKVRDLTGAIFQIKMSDVSEVVMTVAVGPSALVAPVLVGIDVGAQVSNHEHAGHASGSRASLSGNVTTCFF